MLYEFGEWVHFIGIGGSGMSGLARILLSQGLAVSGSDLRKTAVTEDLESRGGKVYYGHSADQLPDGQGTVVVSTAVKADNPELALAKAKGLPILHRGELLAILMDMKKGIAVAGAHGKTTTSAMTGLMLEGAGWDPAIVVGGEVPQLQGSAKWGLGDYLVAEADESDGSFLKLNPFAVIITNIEDDHLDHYGSVEAIQQAFYTFVDKVREVDGFAVLCADDPVVRQLAEDFRAKGGRLVTYGTATDADYRMNYLQTEGMTTAFEVLHQGESLGQVTLHVPGKHNMLNALSVIALGRQIGLEVPAMAGGLAQFTGVGRRFQKLGEVNGITVVDDYAHHPTEIKATLQAARLTRPGRLVCVFQPHRYTRTQHLHREFGKAFGEADVTILTGIYPAGEAPIPGVTARLIADGIRESEGREPHLIEDREELLRFLASMVRPGDLVMTMGAGDIWKTGSELVAWLQQKTGERDRSL